MTTCLWGHDPAEPEDCLLCEMMALTDAELEELGWLPNEGEGRSA